MNTVGVIGAGAWGTALAQTAARAGRGRVVLWAREPEVIESVRAERENTPFLPGVRLHDAVEVTDDPAGLREADVWLAVAPAQHLRSTLQAFAAQARPGLPVVLCAKGVEQGTLKLMTEVLDETLPEARPAVLSGPSFAGEVAKGLPTAVTLACPDEELRAALAAAVAGPSFRPYGVADMIGAEAGGAVKNVLAIACGAAEGRGLGRSAHAALVTRGFAEMTRMAVALGAEAETLSGLCGLGDLVLTCSSPQSRNMSVGLALGRGAPLAEIMADRRTVAEGVQSAPAVAQLAERVGVEMPICAAVCALLDGRMDVDAAMGALLSRPLRGER